MVSKKTKKDTPGSGPLVVLAVLAIIVAGGLFYYVKYGPTKQPTSPKDGRPTIGRKVTIPKATAGNEGATFSSETRDIPEGTDAIEASVNGFLESVPAVQPEARLQAVKYEGDNAELEFSSNFNQTYGTDDESIIIKGIMKAVSSNKPNVKTVTFLAGGKPIETLGSIDLEGPQNVHDWLK